MKRADPLRSFRFLVEVEGIAAAGFTRVKGLQREIRHESYREGGVNDYEHKLLSQVAYPNVILERGLLLDDMWKWALAAADGEAIRKTLWIRLMNESGGPGWAWQVEWALPVKWSVSDLDAQSSLTAMESLEIAHHGLRRAT